MTRKVIVNFSGGKDSTVAILETLKRYPKEEIVLLYENTGAEYLETPEHVQKIAHMLDLPLFEQKPKLDFWDNSKKFKQFPRPDSRFCTWILKQDVVRHWVASNRDMFGDEIIVVTGLRAEESAARAKLGEWSIDNHLTTKNQTVKFWAPVLQMKKQEVFERIEAEGLPLHPAYEFASRLSCWCCIFGKYNEVRTYAEMHPDLYEQACLVEDEIKHKWKLNFGFNDLMKQGRLF